VEKTVVKEVDVPVASQLLEAKRKRERAKGRKEE